MTKNTSSVEAECEENCFPLKRNLQTELDWDELILKQANCKAHSKYLEYKFGSMTVSRFIALKRFFHFCFSHVDFHLHHLNFNQSLKNCFQVCYECILPLQIVSKTISINLINEDYILTTLNPHFKPFCTCISTVCTHSYFCCLTKERTLLRKIPKYQN